MCPGPAGTAAKPRQSPVLCPFAPRFPCRAWRKDLQLLPVAEAVLRALRHHLLPWGRSRLPRSVTQLPGHGGRSLLWLTRFPSAQGWLSTSAMAASYVWAEAVTESVFPREGGRPLQGFERTHWHPCASQPYCVILQGAVLYTGGRSEDRSRPWAGPNETELSCDMTTA